MVQETGHNCKSQKILSADDYNTAKQRVEQDLGLHGNNKVTHAAHLSFMNKFANELPLGGLPYTPEGMNTRVASMVSNLLKNYCINATVEPLDDKEIESLVPKFNSKIPSKTAGR